MAKHVYSGAIRKTTAGLQQKSSYWMTLAKRCAGLGENIHNLNRYGGSLRSKLLYSTVNEPPANLSSYCIGQSTRHCLRHF